MSYSARIESISLERGQRTASISESTDLPFSYTGQLQQGKLTVDLQLHSPVTDCSNEALSAVAIVQRTVVPTPLFLQKDMTWTDSTSASTCSGSIPVTSITSRRYKVVGATDNGILIEQQNKTLSTGEGVQGQHRVKLHSEGTGATQLVINPQTGSLVESHGTHVTSVVVTASGRDRKFTQTTRERISQR